MVGKDVWEKIAFYIKQLKPHLPTLLSWFKPYEAHEGRWFTEWEIEEIFPTLDRRDIRDIEDA